MFSLPAFKFATSLGKLQLSSFTSISSIGVFKGTSPAKGHTFASIYLPFIYSLKLRDTGAAQG